MSGHAAELEVVENAPAARFEIRGDGTVYGFVEYQRTAELVVMTHTEVASGHEGQGVATMLVTQALELVRSEGLLVLPLCPFVIALMARRPEYADLDYRSQPRPVDPGG